MMVFRRTGVDEQAAGEVGRVKETVEGQRLPGTEKRAGGQCPQSRKAQVNEGPGLGREE